jgi:cytochrome c
MGANLTVWMESDMFDTMTLTKTLGAVCGSLLVFLLGAWVAESIFHGSAAGHGDHAEQHFVVFVEGAEEEAAPAEEGPSFEELFAAADPAAGEDVFRACASCHSVVQGENGTGPYLYGVVGRPVQSAQGYDAYSGALIAANPDTWTPEQLNHFLEKPGDYADGTTMTYNGLRKVEDRANLIAYLDSLDG